jgi:competence CoiA-like predicted nuclease
LLYYCPATNQLIILSNIVPVTIRNAIASILIKPLSQMSYYEVVNPQIHSPFPIDSWKNEISHFKLHYPLSPKAYCDSFLRSLYQNHLHLSLLPPEIGLPIPSSLLISTPPIIWQGFLFLDVFQKLSIGDRVSLHEVVSAFAQRIRKREIIVRELPLGTGDVSLVVRDYVALLGECHYLKRVDQSNYQIVRKLNCANNVVEQKQIENDFYQNYSRVMKSAFR